MTVKDFVKKYLEPAKKNSDKNGVPLLVTLAQAALESGWGEHAPKNNFFGIKAGSSWKGDIQVLKTWEVINGKRINIDAEFRAYLTPELCFADHAEVLKKNWPQAFKLSPPLQGGVPALAGGVGSEEAAINFIKAIQSGKKKYATDPDYVNKITQITRLIKGQIPGVEKMKTQQPVSSLPDGKAGIKNPASSIELKVIARDADQQPHKLIIESPIKAVSLPVKPGVEIGTEETHDVIVLGVELGNAVLKTFADGKVNALDALNFVSPALKFPAAISGLDKVPAEIENLSEQELAAEIEYVKKELSIQNDEKAKRIVVAAIKAAYANYELVKAIKE